MTEKEEGNHQEEEEERWEVNAKGKIGREEEIK
jgi:hypothetical protein